MSIKSITIENFKGIRDPVKFDLAPIVLLYGPNSAGKSTLLQALAYLNDVIVHNECNGEYTRSGGESMYLGGFANIVHAHDVSKSIRFELEIDSLSGWHVVGCANNPTDKYDGGYSEFFHKNKSRKDLPFLSTKLVKDGLHVEFIISWDVGSKQAFISSCRFIAQEVVVIDIKVKESGGQSTIEINFDHPCFKIENSRYVYNPSPNKNLGWKSIFDCITHEKSFLMEPQHQEIVFKKNGIFEWPHLNQYGCPEYPVHMSCFMSEHNKILHELESYIKANPELNSQCIFDLVPEDERTIKKRKDFLDTEEGREALKKQDEIECRMKVSPEHEYINTLFITYISTVISGSFELIYEFLKDSIYIGPLRKRPDSTTIQQNITNSSWHDGMAAWQLLNSDKNEDAHNNSNQYISEVNKYLGGQNYFNSGFHIKTGKTLTVEIELLGELQKLLEQNSEVNLAELKQQISHNSKFKKTLKLHDIARGVDVDLTAVGTGISQIVPIITAMLFDDVEVVMIEQPELHIHPRMQVQFGELMVDSLLSKRKHNEKQKLHLIETHSEALLLRLMRRIREPSSAGNRLTPEDLAVYYVEMVDGSTRIVKRINIDEEGDFVDEWPGGFFDESFNENFGGR